MNKYIKTIALATIATLSLTSTAQNTNSAYFMDGYNYRYQLNPAFGNEKNFISIPGIGNINAAMHGTIGLDDILYNIDGKTTTFLNPAVDASFINDLDDVSRLGSNINVNVLSIGFHGLKGYNTISVNVKSNFNTRIPKTLFSLLKENIENKSYDISDFNSHADVYGEIALGHSHQINQKWRIGATVKFLLGGANVDADFEKAQLTLGEDAWTAVTNAKVQASIKGLEYERDINKDTGHEYVNGMDVDGAGLNGFGMALDLGLQFSPNDNLSLSAAVLDLGYINWNNNMVASTGGEKTFTTDKYSFSVNDDATNSFDNEWELLQNDLSALYELEDEGDKGSRSKTLGATLNVGAEYAIPAYRKLKFGLLNSTRFQGDYTWTEFRLSANINPRKAFSAGANVAVGTYGWSFGWLMNISTTGFNMFLGMDHTMGKLAKQGIPLSSNASVNMGINIPF